MSAQAISRKAANSIWFGYRDKLANLDEIANIILGNRQGVPIRIKDVADIIIGKELRSGAATQDGEEIVLGTALMLIGENSRRVSQAVANKLAEINRNLPKGVVITARL